jgi:hypothetical protein
MNASDQTFTFRPGDVLLFQGKSLISRAIRFFDGADVNHAAIAIDSSKMIEAAGNGLRESPIAEALEGNALTLARRLSGQDDLGPAVGQATAFLGAGTPYAYQQIVLLALLSITRRADIGNPLLRAIVRTACDRGAQLINAIFDDGRELMICSEFVYRCYADTHDERYRLELHDDWRQTFALAPGEPQTVVEWARARPEPPPLVMAPSPVGASPEIVATEAEAELAPLLNAYLAEQGTIDAGSTPARLGELQAAAVSDDELHASASRLRDAWTRKQGPVSTMPKAVGSDAWTPVADFVTPGDLEHATPLVEVARLP